MIRCKLPVHAAIVSTIALAALTGCADVSRTFGMTSTEKTSAMGDLYAKNMTAAAEAQKAGDFKSAAALYGRSASIDTQRTAPLMGLSDVLWQMKNPGEAAKVLERARQVDPDNALVLRNLGRAYIGMSNPGKAQEAYQAAIAIDPADPRALSGLGITADMNGDHALAQQHYRAGLAVSPLDLELQNNLAYSLILSKNYDEAASILEPIVNRPGATPRQRQNLAMAYGMMGREDEVRRVATDLNPAEVERNLKVFRNLRLGGDTKAILKDAGQPTFKEGGLKTDPTKPPVMAAASENAPVSAAASFGATDVSRNDLAAPAGQRVEMNDSSAPVGIANESASMSDSGDGVTLRPATKADRPVELAPSSVAAASARSAMTVPAGNSTVYGVGGGKVYLGMYPSEAEARAAWIKVWTGNSDLLGSLMAGIEPNGDQYALYAVGAESKDKASEVCTALRRNGVSCGAAG